MTQSSLNRREFVRTSAAAAAGLAVGLTSAPTVRAGNPENFDTAKIVNYNSDMEYRPCGKTGMMISCVCLGGHWKRVNAVVPNLFQGGSWLSADVNHEGFLKNRANVVSRCIDRGINYIDACTGKEAMAYAKALQGRREKMHLGYSYYEKEVRFAEWRTFDKLKESFTAGLKECGLDYVDLWRITCHEQSINHSEGEVQEIIRALDWAKKEGLARFTGISSHHRPHIKALIEKYPEQLEVIITPYTAKTKVVADETGLWATMQKQQVGWFGIKPYASGSVFQGDSTPGHPAAEEDNRMARLVLRCILCNPAITAPIPGMITPDQVDNVALAVAERRQLDAEEQALLDRAMDRCWANLPHHYQWLKQWETV